MNPKVAVVVSHPIQHFCPLYRTLAASSRVDLRVLFASTAGYLPYFDAGFGQTIKFQEDLLGGFDHEFLPGCPPDLGKTGLIGNPFLSDRLSAFDPDVIQIYGYRHPISRVAMKWARTRKRGILYCSDTELLRPRPLWNRLAKRLILPRIFARCDAFLTVGDSNEQYYRHYGVASDRFCRCPFPIDERPLAESLDRKLQIRTSLREKLSLPSDALILLVVGKLIAAKSPEHVIRAVANIWKMESAPRPYVVFAGSGPEKESLRILADSILPGAVRLPGFINVEDLPNFYVGSDILVHPSSEDAHPLAISEAIFAGLPVIASDRVGSVGPTDDVRVGENGFSYPYADIAGLTELLRLLCSDAHRREAMSRSSRDFAQAHRLRNSADAYIRAVYQASGHAAKHQYRESEKLPAKDAPSRE